MAIVHFVNYKRGTQSRAAMRGVMLYVMQEKKTAWEGGPLVSGINCQPQSVYDDFLNTKLLYHKDGGVMFYHMVQSFPKGAAVNPRQAHEAARRLAEYFDGCEVLVCTHVDREHIHSHCVINSVNFETGKKLHMAKEQIQELMRRNDMICQEMGLPVFEPTAQQARGMSGAEYHVALKGQSWKLRLMNTIDECMKYAADKDAFVSLMASEGYDYNGKRIKPRQKTVHPPEELTPKQVEKWLNEQAVLFERDCRHTPQPVQQLTLAKYIDLWLADIAPGKLAKSTIRRDRQDIERILPALGHYKLTELRPEHFRNFYAELRKATSIETKKPLSEYTIEGVHATLCSILSDAVEGGFLSHNPAWRTYRYAGRKCEKKIADEETAQRIIAALEGESIKYETYFKLIIATGMRRGECCGLKWCDIDWEQRSIHICRNAVKVTDEEIFVKEPKTRAGDRYVYFSAEMESLLREYRQECAYITETYDQRQLTADDFLFRRQGAQLPMTPTTFTYRFKLILKKNCLPQELNVHSLRHTAASLMIAGGTDVATVAGILGHSQPSTTLDIYTHAFDKNKKAASAGLQGMLEI